MNISITCFLMQTAPKDLDLLSLASRLCSYEEKFLKDKANMKSWFLKREYLEKLISAKMNKVKFSNIKGKK